MRRFEDVYFAQHPAYSSDYLDELVHKINSYRNYCQSHGKVSKWSRSLKNYYGISSDGTKSSQAITMGGDQGQWAMAKVNDYRNLVQHQIILITSERPAGIAKAINSDPESLHQARIGSSLAEYYLSQVGWERKFVQACEGDIVADECFLTLDWNQNIGDPLHPHPETGKTVRGGDLELRVIYPWNMVRDPYLSHPDMQEWGIYSYRMNKFNLVEQFPEAKDEILNQQASSKITSWSFDKIQEQDSDQVTVYVLSHKPTDAVEEGRWTFFIPNKVLIDVSYPYSDFNIHRMAQNNIIDTPFGYSNSTDVLVLEEMTDALHTIIISNETKFGGQSIIGPKGADFDYTKISLGFAYFEVDPKFVDKIKPLQMTRTPKEIFDYQEILSRKKETLAGINSVVRGDPEGALRGNSGSALALVQAQSIQFQSGGQRAYYHGLTSVMTNAIKMLQRYADSERVVRITGKVQGQFLKEFKFNKDRISNISSVVFEPVDAAFQSVGGKMAVAENLLQQGMIKNPQQYLTVVRTGSLDALTEDTELDEIAIKSENEDLREGLPVQVILTENHEKHIKSHMSVISAPESKQDARLVQAVLAHIQEHVDTWQGLSMSNPALLIATNQQVLPPPPPPPPLPGGAAAQGGAPMGGTPERVPAQENSNEAMMNGEPAVITKAGEVNMPNMPVNPATGQRVLQP